jgi:YggT family protein
VDTLAQFVWALWLVYTILIFAYIVMGMLPIPYSVWSARLREFLDQTVGPYLAFFRRFIPPLGMIDLSPMVGLLAIYIAARIITTILRG